LTLGSTHLHVELLVILQFTVINSSHFFSRINITNLSAIIRYEVSIPPMVG